MKCFLIILDGSKYKAMYEHMFCESEQQDDVFLISDNKDESLIKKIFLKRKVQKITHGHFDFLYFENNNLSKWLNNNANKYDTIFVIFTNSSLNYNPYLYGTLQQYKKKWKNIKYSLYYVDIIGCGPSRHADYLREKNIFDLVYSIDKKDCGKYQLSYFYTVYSKLCSEIDICTKYDLYFAGVSKRRCHIIQGILDEINDKDINLRIDLVYEEEKQLLNNYDEVVKLYPRGEYLDYSYILEKELSSNVILDIVQPGQEALSLRPYEAVVYNKKLLTNNKSIFEFPYYSKDKMRYFDNPKDIDWDWIKRKEEINYNYKNDFSLLKLLEDIDKKINNI